MRAESWIFNVKLRRKTPHIPLHPATLPSTLRRASMLPPLPQRRHRFLAPPLQPSHCARRGNVVCDGGILGAGKHEGSAPPRASVQKITTLFYTFCKDLWPSNTLTPLIRKIALSRTSLCTSLMDYAHKRTRACTKSKNVDVCTRARMHVRASHSHLRALPIFFRCPKYLLNM